MWRFANYPDAGTLASRRVREVCGTHPDLLCSVVQNAL